MLRPDFVFESPSGMFAARCLRRNRLQKYKKSLSIRESICGEKIYGGLFSPRRKLHKRPILRRQHARNDVRLRDSEGYEVVVNFVFIVLLYHKTLPSFTQTILLQKLCNSQNRNGKNICKSQQILISGGDTFGI